MNVKIVGIKEINYTNKAGRQIIGTELHVTYKTVIMTIFKMFDFVNLCLFMLLF